MFDIMHNLIEHVNIYNKRINKHAFNKKVSVNSNTCDFLQVNCVDIETK